LGSIFSLSPSANGPAAKLMRRLRAAPLSPPEAEPPRATASLGRVDAFLDQLVELPLAEWLVIGEAVVAARERVPVRQRAWDELEAKLVSGRLGVTVWSVRDAVDTAAHIATRESHQWSRQERGTFAAAHGAAEVAALALLARDELPTETYRALTVPFTACIDAAESTHRG
jgi:hypothetical protein